MGQAKRAPLHEEIATDTLYVIDGDLALNRGRVDVSGRTMTNCILINVGAM